MLPRVFSHVAEFNEAGYQSIPALSFIADPLILWSPSGTQIANAQKRGLSVLGPEDLLELVRKRFIRIHGRKEWLTSQEHRETAWKKTRWPHARWSDFDDGVHDLVKEDRGKPIAEKRVFFAEPDGGANWADAQLRDATEAAMTVEKLVREGDLGEKLPPGTCEKIERAGDIRSAAKAVLRDIHNHAAAFSEARALSVEPPAFAPLISKLASEVVEVRDPRPPRSSSLEETLELFDELLLERDAPLSLSELEELLSLRATDPRIEIEVGSLLAERSSAEWLNSQISGDKAARRAWDEIFPADQWDQDRSFVFIAALVAGFEPSVGAGSAAFRFLPRVFSAGKARTRRSSVATDYTGPLTPFLLAYGRSTPTYGEIGRMREKLETFLRRVR